MNLLVKRRCTYATIVFYNLCTGIGYAIIFPTIWNYIHDRLGGNASMLGLIISSYSISSFFVGPLVGLWSDKTQSTRIILIVGILAEICGSIMYFVGYSNWVLVMGRLVAGLGGGGMAAVIADITRTTTEEERTPVLSIVVASRQFGLLIGPALNLFLSKLDFKIYTLPVDKFSSPGLFMAVLWILVMFCVQFMYYNLTSLKDEENIEQLFHGYRRESSYRHETGQSEFESSSENPFCSSYPNYSSNINLIPNARANSLSISVPNLKPEALTDYDENLRIQRNNIKSILCKRYCTLSDDPTLYRNWCQKDRDRPSSECGSSMTDNMIETAERFIQSVSESFRGNCPVASTSGNRPIGVSASKTVEQPNAPDVSIPSLAEEKTALLRRVDLGFFRDEIVVLLGLSFVSCFAQTALETVVTPLAQKFYNFTEMENSYMYLLAGIEIILVYIAIRYVSKRVSDRVLLIFGIIMLSIATGSLLSFIPDAKTGELTTFPYFIVAVILDLVGIPVIIVCSASLLSKVVRQENQALAQGLRRSVISLGCILGPLWGGSYLHLLTILFSVPLALTVLIACLFMCSYKRMA